MPSFDSVASRVLRVSPALCRAVAYAAAVLVAAPFAYHLARGSIAYLGLFEDDYFYYAIVADHLASSGHLTYDGVTPTNGFHPLWFLVVYGLRCLTGSLDTTFYVLLSAVFLGSMIVTYELSRRLARVLGASAALAPAVALVPLVGSFAVIATGMETALDVPLLLALLVELARPGAVTPRRAARTGLLASLAILARLDLALVVALLAVGWVLLERPKPRTLATSVAAFCAAGLAVPAYALFNLVAFGSILPMSALAKQLVKVPGVNISYLRVVASYTQYGAVAGITLVLGAAALFVAWRRRGTRPVLARPALLVATLILSFAAIFFSANALTGWIFFGWYAYPLAAALVTGLTLVGLVAATRLGEEARRRAGAAVVAGAALLASGEAIDHFVTHGPMWSVEDNGLLAMSVDLSGRLSDRQGRFAMGAIGGFVTYLLRKPVVQTEGLIEDRAMVEHIRSEDALGAVLRAYQVDYLIVSQYRGRMEKKDGCYLVTQPDAEWAGKRVAKMRGALCAEPVVHFKTVLPAHRWSEFSTLETYVFDVRNATWRE